MAMANGLAVVGEEVESVAPGSALPVILLDD
jgi:hypothetical protein